MIIECSSGEEALQFAEKENSDVVVLGLNLTEELDAISACRKIKALTNPPYILVHSSYSFTETICSCLFGDADGYLHKWATCEEVVWRVGCGERVWCVGEEAEELPNLFWKTSISEKLTDREQEILVLMIGRNSRIEIAHKLHVSTETIKTHTTRIFRKLGMSNRREFFAPYQR